MESRHNPSGSVGEQKVKTAVFRVPDRKARSEGNRKFCLMLICPRLFSFFLLTQSSSVDLKWAIFLFITVVGQYRAPSPLLSPWL
jgi:hypothetical protein